MALFWTVAQIRAPACIDKSDSVLKKNHFRRFWPGKP
jgi:hypothetical protein